MFYVLFFFTSFNNFDLSSGSVFVHVHVDIDKDNDCIRSIMMSLQMICGNFFNLGFFIESLITVVTDFRLFVVLVISRLLFFTERN